MIQYWKNKYYGCSLLLCIITGEIINKITEEFSMLIAGIIGAALSLIGMYLDKISNERKQDEY